MAELNAKPGSSTPGQRQRLHQLKRKLGWSDDQLHEAIGAASTTLLSSAEASACIRRLGGGELPYPPGQKPAPFAGRPKRTDATRMIAPDHEEQIVRLLRVYFDDEAAGLAWLKKDFDADTPRDLLTAARASQVIYVLKQMIARRRSSDDVEGEGVDRDDVDDDAGASVMDVTETEISPVGAT